jgi:methyl-accepting chemotaxis protein
VTYLRKLSIKQRLIGLCVFFCLISLVPLGSLVLNQKANWDFNEAELRGMAPANALIQLIAQVQRHRGLSTLTLLGKSDSARSREETLGKLDEAWRRFDQLWQATGLPGNVTARSEALHVQFAQLQKAVSGKEVSMEDSFSRHTALVDDLLALLFDINGSDNMLFDPQDTTYLLIIAGLQEGPRVTELAARIRGLGTASLASHGGLASDVQWAFDTHGRLLERIANLEMHLKGVAARQPELHARIIEPAMGKLDALRQLSNDTRAMLQGENNKVSAMQPAQYFAYASQFIDAQTAVSSQVTAEIEKALVARQGDIERQLAVLGMLVALMAGIGLWLMVATVRGIVSSLRKMERLATSLGQGDLTQRCASTRTDEVGDCMNALETARQNWERMLHQLVDAIDGVSSTSAQIAAGSQDLNGRTQTAAHSLEGTSQSIRSLTGTVQQTANSALQANEQARTARDTAEQGEQVMSQVVANMDNISTSSRKIADIIGVIDGIAFQTNILALNAAVEAARAGELGRGFAVVASEVRNLAQRSANSAREIKSLINDSLSKVEVGTQLVNDAGASMQAIMRSNQQVTQIIGEISAATRDQSQGFAHVNQAIAQLDDMTVRNSAMVRESSSAADELHAQAERLRQLVALFRFSDRGLAS